MHHVRGGYKHAATQPAPAEYLAAGAACDEHAAAGGHARAEARAPPRHRRQRHPCPRRKPFQTVLDRCAPIQKAPPRTDSLWRTKCRPRARERPRASADRGRRPGRMPRRGGGRAGGPPPPPAAGRGQASLSTNGDAAGHHYKPFRDIEHLLIYSHLRIVALHYCSPTFKRRCDPALPPRGHGASSNSYII